LQQHEAAVSTENTPKVPNAHRQFSTKTQGFSHAGAAAVDDVDGPVAVEVVGLQAIDTSKPTPQGSQVSLLLVFTKHFSQKWGHVEA
jgi:hypothetical protein